MRIGHREFSPHLLPTLATLVLLPVLLSLGFWQLDRAEQKKEILRQYQQQQGESVLNLNKPTAEKEFYPYQRVEVTGRFDTSRQFLLDNKVYQGQAGYQVITPLLLPNNGQVVLVNRGWLPQTESRQELPVIPTPTENLEIVGQLKLDIGNGFQLGESGILGNTWPRVIQWLDIEQIGKSLGYKLQPFIILQDPDGPAGFVRDWYIKKISPEKNISYAVQWFGLALALVIIYLVVNIHKVEEASSKDGIE
jgi:surfeit locus 1 family protein